MATNSYITNFKLELVDTTVSPNTYTELPEILSPGTIGETAPLVDVTHTQSTSREYISGLPDGDEFSVECNRILNASPDVQGLFISLIEQTKTVRVTMLNRLVSPNVSKSYIFDVVFLGYSFNPAVGEQDKITYNFKISGGVQEA